MSKPTKPVKKTPAIPVEGADITQLELAEIEAKLKDHDNDRNCLEHSELNALRIHESFLRGQKRLLSIKEQEAKEKMRPTEQAARVKRDLEQLVATRNKPAIIAMIAHLRNVKLSQASFASKNQLALAGEIARHEKRIAKLKAAYAVKDPGSATIDARIASAEAALIAIDTAFKCKVCNKTFPSKRNFADHMIEEEAKKKK